MNKSRRIFSTFALFCLLGGAPSAFSAESTTDVAKVKPVSVQIVTNMGAITVELDAAKAPKTVENFLSYVKSGFYNGTIFHRVIPGFMIQGGGFTSDFRQKPTQAPIVNEADNGLSNRRGSIAMARTSDPDSATAQFFINVADNKFLDYSGPSIQGAGYAVFGHVTSGMNVVDQIVSTPTGAAGPFPQDVPKKTVLIESIKVLP
ncbi:MAG: cyclophilin [Halothiobacillus sp. 15-55-196]|jgi:cyclophilin family peptidyl-prolyl cis-trans isomerase|uniref:peptidylprolyl isomerase n=1 Tax=Halothiobacillus sp. 15-55-196 TaxID=1970382 RepID=UPI000BD2CB91|nr:peptidylprolyl isomerase [Halothiobacillus sp. 15-55-196]OZB37013.1 MAG: cyclophilin [Halothiobacillus sp. 15-55-196]